MERTYCRIGASLRAEKVKARLVTVRVASYPAAPRGPAACVDPWKPTRHTAPARENRRARALRGTRAKFCHHARGGLSALRAHRGVRAHVWRRAGE